MLQEHMALEVVSSTELATDGTELVHVPIKKGLARCLLTDYRSRPQRECMRYQVVRQSMPLPLSIASSCS